MLQVGAGAFGQSWLQFINNDELVEFVGLVDMSVDNLQDAQSLADLSEDQLFTDLIQAIERTRPDALLLVTPQSTHRNLTQLALDYGLHVLMEKPLTHTFEDAIALRDYSRQYPSKKVMVSQNYRWMAPAQTVRQLLDQGIIGPPEYVNYNFSRASVFGGWRDEFEHILLEDMSIHHFDLMRFWLGSNATQVVTQSYRPSWSWFRGNPNADVQIEFNNGVRVNYCGSWVARGRQTTWLGDVRLAGPLGAIEIIDDRVWLYSNDAEEGAQEIPLLQLQHESRAGSLHHFAEAIVNDTSVQTSIEDNIHSLDLMFSSVASAKEGKKVTLALQ